MANMERFVESVPMRTPAEVAPLAVSTLLNWLGVRRQPEDVEKKAVAHWLAENTPTDQLRRSIQRRGWNDLVEQAS